MKGKIPKHAKKVFEGILFDVFHWDQEMFDGSIKTFEAVRRLGSSQIIAIKGDKIIMLSEEQPHIGKFTSLIGGHIERHEKPLENAKKEMIEETGYKGDFELLYELNIGSKIDWPSYFYVARNLKKYSDPTPEVGSERIKIYEVTFDEFVEETQKECFRNKFFQTYIFKLMNTEGELEKFRKLLFKE